MSAACRTRNIEYVLRVVLRSQAQTPSQELMSFCHRTALTSVLAEQIDTVDPTDIVILNQEIVNVDDLECLDMSVRVLGPTREFIYKFQQ